MEQRIEGASFYVICPECNKPIPFQGVDMQYYLPIGFELKNELYSMQKEVMDTGKIIPCPHCKKVFKAIDGKFIVNDF